jgi:hypothetical protein
LTGFKRSPGFRDLALKPYHELLESPDPTLISLCQVFPDEYYLGLVLAWVTCLIPTVPAK